jgi:hypothetical protein
MSYENANYRNYLGTLNVNLKVLAARLDLVLADSKLETDLESLVSTAMIYHLESQAINMADHITEARKRDYRLQNSAG